MNTELYLEKAKKAHMTAEHNEFVWKIYSELGEVIKVITEKKEKSEDAVTIYADENIDDERAAAAEAKRETLVFALCTIGDLARMIDEEVQIITGETSK